jgi:hypothetical protein
VIGISTGIHSGFRPVSRLENRIAAAAGDHDRGRVRDASAAPRSPPIVESPRLTDVLRLFLVGAVNPANGLVIEFLLSARSEAEARRIAEEIGMLSVLVKPVTGDRVPQRSSDPP